MLNLALCVRERSDTPRFGVKGLGANLSILKACLGWLPHTSLRMFSSEYSNLMAGAKQNAGG